MKKVILSLLLAVIASPAMSQTLDEYEYLGYQTGIMKCYFIRAGIKDRKELNRMLHIVLSSGPLDRQKFAVLASESEKYGYDSQAVRSYIKGSEDGISPCKDTYTKLFGYP